MTSSANILEFWFGNLKDEDDFPVEKAGMWFRDGKKFDSYIKEHFEAACIGAMAGAYDDWTMDAKSLLALIILLDQFPRNIYRNTPEAYASDQKAEELCRMGIHKGYDQELMPVERVFMYMPLMHTESIEGQRYAVELFKRLADNATPAIELPLRNNLDFAIQHAKIIEEFGRFPYRNTIFKRESTAAEKKFLESEGASWA
ncbi:MAG: hypothetical protein ACI9CF_000888 [Candidatus Omnitrophota bacterium]|jgi:uncharacterized protein (DUF924 family)